MRWLGLMWTMSLVWDKVNIMQFAPFSKDSRLSAKEIWLYKWSALPKSELQIFFDFLYLYWASDKIRIMAITLADRQLIVARMDKQFNEGKLFYFHYWEIKFWFLQILKCAENWSRWNNAQRTLLTHVVYTRRLVSFRFIKR